jgi:hypothetical protein
MLKLDQGNRVVTMDRAFHDDSASFSFDNCEGPHGRRGFSQTAQRGFSSDDLAV